MRWNVERQATTYLVLLAVIVIGLLVQRSLRAKARAGPEESSWSVVGTGHALPAKLARLPEVRVAKWVLGGLLAIFLLVVPFAAQPSQVSFITVTLVYGMVAVSLVVLTGWGGVVSLGQVAIVGVGGVVAANLIADHNLDLFVTLLLAGAAGGAIALLLGLPALRVSGQFLAVTTLASPWPCLYFLSRPTTSRCCRRRTPGPRCSGRPSWSTSAGSTPWRSACWWRRWSSWPTCAGLHRPGHRRRPRQRPGGRRHRGQHRRDPAHGLRVLRGARRPGGGHPRHRPAA